MRRFIVILTLLSLGALCAEAQHYDRGYELNPSSPFVSKGTWVAGGTARYTQHVNENFNLLLIDGINSEGFNLSVNPKLFYMFKDNAEAPSVDFDVVAKVIIDGTAFDVTWRASIEEVKVIESKRESFWTVYKFSEN